MGGKKRLTNDEAINVLKNAVLIGATWIGDEKQFYDLLDAVKMAVEALKRSEIPNCSDAISRQAVIDTLCDWICGVGERCVKTHCQCIRRIESIPSVDVPDTNVGDMISRQGAMDGGSGK